MTAMVLCSMPGDLDVNHYSGVSFDLPIGHHHDGADGAGRASAAFDRRRARALRATRMLDMFCACLAVAFLFPMMLIAAALVWLFDPGPVLFAQTRIGAGGRPFRCYKFRTMAVDAEARLTELLRTDPVARAEWEADRKLRNDPRIVGIGGFLRKSSLDELPQLLNVILGDMSLVGPRPIVAGEVALYGRYFAHYCSVSPGITGLWQISGRNDVAYRRRVALDVTYCRTKSLRGDIAIMLLTIPRIMAARGCY